jgi:hypothetical protein
MTVIDAANALARLSRMGRITHRTRVTHAGVAVEENYTLTLTKSASERLGMSLDYEDFNASSKQMEQRRQFLSDLQLWSDSIKQPVWVYATHTNNRTGWLAASASPASYTGRLR